MQQMVTMILGNLIIWMHAPVVTNVKPEVIVVPPDIHVKDIDAKNLLASVAITNQDERFVDRKYYTFWWGAIIPGLNNYVLNIRYSNKPFKWVLGQKNYSNHRSTKKCGRTDDEISIGHLNFPRGPLIPKFNIILALRQV